jgi:hypothetical protein
VGPALAAAPACQPAVGGGDDAVPARGAAHLGRGCRSSASCELEILRRALTPRLRALRASNSPPRELQQQQTTDQPQSAVGLKLHCIALHCISLAYHFSKALDMDLQMQIHAMHCR